MLLRRGEDKRRMPPNSRADWGEEWIGRVVGTYRLLRVLGEGGMGVVFLAEHVRMGRQAALKLLHPSSRERPDIAKRLGAEARAMGRLTHPGIVAILDHDVLPDGTGYLVMEYLPGQPLRDRLQAMGGRLAPLQAIAILAECAFAMAAAHAAGVIHRDLSPANIMCMPTGEGEGGAIKILDFGLARLQSPDGASSSSHNTTRDGAVLGTLKYMAPEQCLDAHSADEAADVYSLGAIGYELLTGAPPFSAASSWELIERHLREPPPPLPERSTADDSPIPADLRTLLHEMLAKSPLSRPPMAQVRERLLPLLPEESPGQRSQPVLPPLSAPLSRRARERRRRLRRLLWSAALLGVLGSLLGLAYYANKQRRLAVRQRQQTLASTAEILTIIRRNLRPMPGATAASQGLLDLTDRQLTTLFEQLPDDLEVAEALVRLHTLRGDFARHHAGLSTAKSEFEVAIRGAESLVRARPAERGYRLLLANAHDGLGDALEQVADLQQARTQYERALSIRQELLRAAPGDALPAQEVVGSHLLLGDLAQAQGRQRSALAAYETAQSLLSPLWKREPDNKAYRWQMCGIHYRIAQTLIQLGRSVDGLAMAERAVDMLRRIAPTDQQGSSYHVLYSRVLQVRGLAREHLGRAEEAVADLRQSYDEVSALLKAAPNDVQARRAVIDSGLRLSDYLLHAGKTAEAAPLSSELLRIGESLFSSDDKNHGHRWRLAATLQRVGDVELRTGQVTAAQARYARALELQESLHMAAPDAARHRDRLVALYERLGDAAGSSPYIVQALPHYEDALRQIAEQERLEAGWLELRLCQARILRKRARIEQALGRSGAATQALKAAREILTALQSNDPADALIRAELAENARLSDAAELVAPMAADAAPTPSSPPQKKQSVR